MDWWFYVLIAIAVLGCAYVVRARRGRDSNEDEELNRRIDERVDRLDLTRRNPDRDS
ncbi:hypothetical protein [Bradyrhizobium viridifuturi]|uniref:hypothetical protein n=1 Tax=Bradyrhizobium viridifuturi TaxID=1654716 RepID=UPI000B2B87F0|nr:hypothetical protein [Bradyrhizobium viridifuturi]